MVGMLESIVGIIVLMLILILILILLACKPWRLLTPSPSRPLLGNVGELQRPLVSRESDLILDQNDLSRGHHLEEAYQSEGFSHSSRTKLVQNQWLSPVSPLINQGDSLIVDIDSEPSEDIVVGQTLKLPHNKDYFSEARKHDERHHQQPGSISGLGNESSKQLSHKLLGFQRSCLSLEVISGPSTGLRYSVLSTTDSTLPLTLGRVTPSVVTLKDSEVSGKHASINWNANKLKWELVDMGSLNGTLLNSQPINHPDSASRQWGDPIELSNGDVMTLGTTSKIHISITSQDDYCIPFGIGVASDPMALRRGGKKLPMEDVFYYQWPIPGADKFGLFGIFDGHGGAGAAKSASKILPVFLANNLSDAMKSKILSECDASDILRDAFVKAEDSLDHCYEGCTATVLLVWIDDDKKIFAQCANVGDSACILSVDGKQIKMTEDHRVISPSERMRFQQAGEPLRDGETRLHGLNLARTLGDKFLKFQDSRFSSEPYISQVVHIDEANGGFALLASDGFWDVINVKKAAQLVAQLREMVASEGENQAEKIANGLLNEARALRTKDNTSIIFLDFDRVSRISLCKKLIDIN